MPEDLSIPTTTKWGADQNLGVTGAGLKALRGGGAGAGEALGAAIGHGGAAAISALAEYGARTFGIPYSQDSANAAVSVATGSVLNPYLTAVFDGVDFRNFAFRFKFSPFNEGECDEINTIINEFRKAALPSSSGLGTLNYPDEFEIEYQFNGKNHPFLHKFRRSVLTDIDVQYGAGDQWSQHRNGMPTMINLSMKFKEIDIVLRDDIDRGF